MIKKILLVATLMLCSGCQYVADLGIELPWAQSTSQASATPVAVSENEAIEIAQELEIYDSMTQLRDRNVRGMIFQGESIYTDATVLLGEDGISDTVGVFYVSDLETSLNYISEYLADLKTQTNVYDYTEVFKINNAVVRDNGVDKIVLIICSDIEQAKEIAEEVIAE